MFDASNYRGVHLTSQLSKVVERLLQQLCAPFLVSVGGFGANQFAYQKERGARDALAMFVMRWIKALTSGLKVGVYCSDVSGAFDRVSICRLTRKLKRRKIHPTLIEVLTFWLKQRRANVVVSGQQSKETSLSNQVYQGTVLGPQL